MRRAGSSSSLAAGELGSPQDPLSWESDQGACLAVSELQNFASEERRGAVRYLHAIRQHWRLVALLVVGSVAAAWIFVATAEKRYEASVDIVITPVLEAMTPSRA